jgi:alpha-1,4-galacturonosyltransferase
VRVLSSGANEAFDTQSKIQKLSNTILICVMGQRLLSRGMPNFLIVVGSTPKSLHCLVMRLLKACLANAFDVPVDLPVL